MWTLILTSLILATPVEIDVKTLDGQTVSGSIVSLDADRLTLNTSKGSRSLDIDKLFSISLKRQLSTPHSQSMIWIDLSDGSSVTGQDYTTQDGQAKIKTTNGIITLPTKTINAVRFGAVTSSLKEEWNDIRKTNTDSDLLVIRKGDSIDYHEGVIGNVNDKVIQFTLDDDTLPVKRSKVFGLIYHNVAEQSPQPTCQITLSNGSRWAATTCELTNETLRWTTPTHIAATYPMVGVTQIDFSQGKIVYLSDLTPESTSWSPYFDTADKSPSRQQFFAPRTDRTQASEPLLLGKKTYRKGLAIHSRTKIVYRLPNGFRRFKATVGIDDRVRPNGNVQLVITGNDRILHNSTITGTDTPKTLDIDITDIKRLSILVDFGEELDVSDHLDICEARLVK